MIAHWDVSDPFRHGSSRLMSKWLLHMHCPFPIQADMIPGHWKAKISHTRVTISVCAGVVLWTSGCMWACGYIFPPHNNTLPFFSFTLQCSVHYKSWQNPDRTQGTGWLSFFVSQGGAVPIVTQRISVQETAAVTCFVVTLEISYFLPCFLSYVLRFIF